MLRPQIGLRSMQRTEAPARKDGRCKRCAGGHWLLYISMVSIYRYYRHPVGILLMSPGSSLITTWHNLFFLEAVVAYASEPE